MAAGVGVAAAFRFEVWTQSGHAEPGGGLWGQGDLQGLCPGQDLAERGWVLPPWAGFAGMVGLRWAVSVGFPGPGLGDRRSFPEPLPLGTLDGDTWPWWEHTGAAAGEPGPT